MSEASRKQGERDARDNKAPANMWNAPSAEREKYNAAYDAERKKQQH